eukprot:scaffold22043_cov84-Isochrysis_galbana.AAC.6
MPVVLVRLAVPASLAAVLGGGRVAQVFAQPNQLGVDAPERRLLHLALGVEQRRVVVAGRRRVSPGLVHGRVRRRLGWRHAALGAHAPVLRLHRVDPGRIGVGRGGGGARRGVRRERGRGDRFGAGGGGGRRVERRADVEVNAALVGSHIVAHIVIHSKVAAGVAPQIAAVGAVPAGHVVRVRPRLAPGGVAGVCGGGEYRAWDTGYVLGRAMPQVRQRFGQRVRQVQVTRHGLGERLELLRRCRRGGGEGGWACGRGGGWAPKMGGGEG